MQELPNLKLIDSVLVGNIIIGTDKAELILNNDLEINSEDDFPELKLKAREIIQKLTPEKVRELKDEISKALNNTSVGADLILRKIIVYPECFLLKYISEKDFPKDEIVAMLNYSYQIKDVDLF